MQKPGGHNPGERLDDLLHSVMDWNENATHNQQDGHQQDGSSKANNNNQPDQPYGESKMSNKSKSNFSTSAFVTTLVSAIALLFSGYSFYETVLKQAELKIYPPALVHMYRSTYRDVFAIPLTISNDGAKRGTILSFDLKVTNLDTKDTMNFDNLYFGNNPKDTSRIFTPLTMSGRANQSEVIMFFAEKSGSFFKTTGGVRSNLRFELTINAEEAEYLFKPEKKTRLSFDMTTGFIQSFRQMEQGSPTVFYKIPKEQTEATKQETPAKSDTPVKPDDKTEKPLDTETDTKPQ